MVHFLLFRVTLRPPKLVLKQRYDMLFIVFLNIEVTFYQKKFKHILQSEKKDILLKEAIKKNVLSIMENFN